MTDADYNDYAFSSDDDFSSTESETSAEAGPSAVAVCQTQNNDQVVPDDYQTHDNNGASHLAAVEDYDYYASFGTDLERWNDDQRRFKVFGQLKRSGVQIRPGTTSKNSSKPKMVRMPAQKRDEIFFDKKGNLWYSYLKQKGTKTNVYENERAVFHHWIRAQLSRMENAKGRYAFPTERERGVGPWDTTCFCPIQRDWGLTRANYAPIIFEYERLNRQKPEYDVGKLYFGDVLVIDYGGKPIRAFQEIPLVISSAFEGGFIEPAMRLHEDIAYGDIRARQPPFIEIEQAPPGTKKKTGMNTTRVLRPMYGCNALSQRARRFREKPGGISWQPEVNSPAVKAFMDSCLSQAARVGNSTRNCTDLTDTELAQLRAATALTSPANAKKRATEKGKTKYRRQFDPESAEPEVEARAPSPQSMPSLPISTHSTQLQSERERGQDLQQFGLIEQPNQPDYFVYLKRGPIVADIFTFSEALHNPDVDMEDPRHAFPTNQGELIALQNALDATAHCFEGVLGHWPVTTTSTSYINQYYEIQNQFMQEWDADLESIPRLYGRQRWMGDISNWESGTFGPPVEPGEWDGARDFLGVRYIIYPDPIEDVSPHPTAPLPAAPLSTAPHPAAPHPAAPHLAAPYPAAPFPAVPFPAVPFPTAPLPTAPLPAAPLPAALPSTASLSILEQKPKPGSGDQEFIQTLLKPTKIHFAWFTGRGFDDEDSENSYAEEYAKYQHALYDWARYGGQGRFSFNSDFKLIGLVEYTLQVRAVWNMRWDEERFGPRLDL